VSQQKIEKIFHDTAMQKSNQDEKLRLIVLVKIVKWEQNLFFHSKKQAKQKLKKKILKRKQRNKKKS